MARLSTTARAKLSKAKFAGPGRTFPVPDKAHAIAAKRLAPRSVKAGNITKGQEATIDAKANAVLKKPKGGNIPSSTDTMHQLPGKTGHFNYK